MYGGSSYAPKPRILKNQFKVSSFEFQVTTWNLRLETLNLEFFGVVGERRSVREAADQVRVEALRVRMPV
jgi:hypothetical protein